MNKKIVATWQENNTLYTIIATPIEETTISKSKQDSQQQLDLISVYQYLGNRTPEYGTGAKIYQHAKNIGAKYEAAELNTPYYQGKIMLYERSFLDSYFNNNETTISSDDDLPF